LATVFDKQNGNWEELPAEKALFSIEEHLAKVEPIYSSACHPDFIVDGEAVKNDNNLQEQLSRRFASCLKLAPITAPPVGAAVR